MGDAPSRRQPGSSFCRTRDVVGQDRIDAGIVECMRHLGGGKGARQRHREHGIDVQREVGQRPGHAIVREHGMTLRPACTQPLDFVLEQ